MKWKAWDTYIKYIMFENLGYVKEVTVPKGGYVLVSR